LEFRSIVLRNSTLSLYFSISPVNDNDTNLYELSDYVEEKFKIPKLIVGDFNYISTVWYSVYGSGASTRCSSLNDNEMAFVSSLRENLLMQHVTNSTRQRGSDATRYFRLKSFIGYQYFVSFVFVMRA